MRFWYLTSARLPDDSVEGTRIFHKSFGQGDAEAKRLLTAIYEWVPSMCVPLYTFVTLSRSDHSRCPGDRFQREFTKGVPPDWTITRIEHSKLLDWGGLKHLEVIHTGRHSSFMDGTKLDLSTFYTAKTQEPITAALLNTTSDCRLSSSLWRRSNVFSSSQHSSWCCLLHSDVLI